MSESGASKVCSRQFDAQGKEVDLAMKNKNEQLESSDDEEFEGVVQADFVFFNPEPDDFHGVKVLWKNYRDDKKQWDLSGFTDLILGQSSIGPVVKLRMMKEKSLPEIMKVMLGGQERDVGLVISQCVVNLPPQLLPPLYDGIFDEVSWQQKMSRRKHTENHSASSITCLLARYTSIRRKAVKRQGQVAALKKLLYTVSRKTKFFTSFSHGPSVFLSAVRTQQHSAHELRNCKLLGLVMAVEASKVGTFREQLHSLIDE